MERGIRRIRRLPAQKRQKQNTKVGLRDQNALHVMIPITAITTLAHLYALQVSPSFQYSAIIITNTGLSFLWHCAEEQNILLAIFDHGLAILWGLTDLSYGYSTGYFYPAFVLNFLVFILDGLTVYTDRDSYELWHSAWHLVSAYKVFVLASLFSASQV